jgi:hypothetical protein
LRQSKYSDKKGTPQVKRSSWSRGLSVSADGSGVVAHVGSVALRLLADRVGLTDRLSVALTRRSFSPVHDRGRVLVDVAVMLADGGETIADIDVLRHQRDVVGAVASAPTVWRALDELTPARLRRIEIARARVRRHVWAQLRSVPASRVADRDLGATVVLDVDATLVTAHSEKEQARPTFKGGFGFHPIAVWCDNTSEWLSVLLRPGNAGANTAADHIAVLAAAVEQVPATYRRDLLVRADGAGCTHAFLAWLIEQNQIRGRHVEFSVGFAATEAVRAAIRRLPTTAWSPAIDADGELRDGGDVAELTGLLDLSGYPQGTRVIVRREHPHPGAQLSLFEEADGWRYQPFATNTATGQLAFLEARHRAHARVEDRIRHAKDSGLRRLPSRQFQINAAWCTAVSIAADLIAWLRLLALDGALAAAEPKALRYRLLHVPARLTTSGRRRHLRIPSTWPWANALATAFARINAIPAPS